LVKPKTKILELGSSTGFMSDYFRKKLKCQVIGVDINPEAKPDIAGDLNQAKIWGEIKKQAPFDLVFASSVLEHLPQPEKTLVKIKSVLKPGGRLIATTGNISWWRQRWRILLKGWEYEDYGLMDKTHLRFFNYFTFQKLITDAGFKIKSVAIDPGGGVKYFNWLVKLWPNLYALQICVEAVNR
jgi:SAM-dependent methyltransferase